MYCPQCGERNPPGAERCSECNQPLPLPSVGPRIATPMPATIQTPAAQVLPPRTFPELPASMPPPVAPPAQPPSILRPRLAPPMTHVVPNAPITTSSMPLAPGSDDDFGDRWSVNAGAPADADDFPTLVQPRRLSSDDADFESPTRVAPMQVLQPVVPTSQRIVDIDAPTAVTSPSTDPRTAKPAPIDGFMVPKPTAATVVRPTPSPSPLPSPPPRVNAVPMATSGPVDDVTMKLSQPQSRAPSPSPSPSPRPTPTPSVTLELPATSPLTSSSSRPAPLRTPTPTPTPAPKSAVQPTPRVLSLLRGRHYAMSVVVDAMLQAVVVLPLAWLGMRVAASSSSLQAFVDALHSRGPVVLALPLLLMWVGLLVVHAVGAVLGASVGQRAAGARLVHPTTGESPSRGRVVPLVFIAATTTMMLLVGPLFGVLFDAHRRSLAERLAGVVAVRN
jgi:hypothetical protein